MLRAKSTLFCQYLETLRQFPVAVLANPTGYVRRPGKDFTRRRSLFLERLLWFNISLIKTTLNVELDRFFDNLGTGEIPVTKSAFSQARKKILPRFYAHFLQLSSDAWYALFPIARWKGFRLWATDGSGFRLPDVSELGDAFGWHENQHNSVPSTRMLVSFDVLNRVITKVQLHTRYVAEIMVAKDLIQAIPSDVLMVYDRGFGSHLIPFLHQHFGSNCLIRLRVEFSNTVKAFLQSGKKQAIVTEKLQIKAKQTLQAMGIPVTTATTITYRLLRVTLPNGETEVLMTTLLDQKKHRHSHFCVLYNLRWGIETCFFVLKSYLQLANFSAHTENGCWQDIYCHFIHYNLQTASFVPLKKPIKALNKIRLHDYQPNRNVAAGLLKRFIIKFALGPPPKLLRYLRDYFRQILQSMEPLRPEKNKERRRRLMRGTERHTHEKNYRRAF